MNAHIHASALIDHTGVEIYLAGGRIDKRLAVATGAEAVDCMRGFRADLCLLGVCAIHPEIGLTRCRRRMNAPSSASW